FEVNGVGGKFGRGAGGLEDDEAGARTEERPGDIAYENSVVAFVGRLGGGNVVGGISSSRNLGVIEEPLVTQRAGAGSNHLKERRTAEKDLGIGRLLKDNRRSDDREQ